jgi:hypothetical protein
VADDEIGFAPDAPAAAPTQSTLAERQDARARLEQRADALERQIQSLEEMLVGLPDDQQEGFRDTIAALRSQQKALRAEISKTGVGTTGRTIGGLVGAVAGGLGGGAAGSLLGPAGTAGGGIAGSAAGTALGSAFGTMADLRRAQPVTEEEASNLISSNVIEDVVWDVGGNVLLLGAGKVLKLALKPGVKERLMRQLEKEKIAGRVDIADKQRVAAAEELFDVKSRVPGKEAGEEATAAAARQVAVGELADRGRGFVPTPGQITGKAPLKEKLARSLRADDFKAQGEAMEQGARGMREELVAPRGNPSREQLGMTIQKQAESVEQAVKNRTRPVFEAAKRVGVEVDSTPILARIDEILKKDVDSAGRLLKPGERSELEKIARSLRPDVPESEAGEIVAILGPDGAAARPALEAAGDVAPPVAKPFTAEGVFDFISGNKRAAREMTADGVPSKFYSDALGDINEIADKQYTEAINQVGGKQFKAALDGARNEYRLMMNAVYDSAVTDALKRNPEDVGRLFWQNGNVTEIKQLQNLLEMGVKEKTLTKDQVKSINESVVRGFLSDGVQSIESAAKWSDMLKADTKKRETWQILIAQEGMGQLDQGMRVLEQAAKVASTKNAALSYSGSGMISNLPARIAIGVTMGFVGPKALVLFAGAEVWARMMATALARGDKGAFMTMQAVLRASSVGDPKKMTALRPAVTKLTQWAVENGFGDEITTEEPTAEEQQ